jgi:hypothetical protein
LKKWLGIHFGRLVSQKHPVALSPWAVLVCHTPVFSCLTIKAERRIKKLSTFSVVDIDHWSSFQLAERKNN